MAYIKEAILIHLDEEVTKPLLCSSAYSQDYLPNYTLLNSSSSSIMSSCDPENGSLHNNTNGNLNSNQQVVVPQTAHQISTGIFFSLSSINFFLIILITF